MARRDTKRVAKYARDAYEWRADVKPKGQRKHKRKERQDGAKEIRDIIKRMPPRGRLTFTSAEIRKMARNISKKPRGKD